jgi:transcription elongation regulator 1
VRDRADQEMKEKSAVLRKKKDDFRELLKEAISNPKTAPSFSEFSTKYARDERYKGIEKTKDRESMYNDFLVDLRKHLEKEDKYGDKEARKKNFYAMLKEMKHLHRYSSWTETKKQLENDSRYKAIDSSAKREDYFRDYCKGLDEKEKDRDKEKERDKEKSNGNGESSGSKRDREKDKDREKDRDKDKDREKHKKSSDENGEKREKVETDSNGREDGESTRNDDMEDGERMEYV